jgi:hypothetical protein
MTFDRLPNESTQAYQAARTYFEMGEGRTSEAVGKKLGKSTALMERWSAAHHWVDRAAEWDADQRARQRGAEDEALKQEAQKWAKRQLSLREERWRISQELKRKAEDMLKFPVIEKTVQGPDGTTVVKPAKWTFADAAKMAETGLKLEALSCGLPTDRTEMSGPEGQPLIQSSPVVVILPENGRDK